MQTLLKEHCQSKWVTPAVGQEVDRQHNEYVVISISVNQQLNSLESGIDVHQSITNQVDEPICSYKGWSGTHTALSKPRPHQQVSSSLSKKPQTDATSRRNRQLVALVFDSCIGYTCCCGAVRLCAENWTRSISFDPAAKTASSTCCLQHVALTCCWCGRGLTDAVLLFAVVSLFLRSCVNFFRQFLVIFFLDVLFSRQSQYKRVASQQQLGFLFGILAALHSSGASSENSPVPGKVLKTFARSQALK